MNFPTLPACFHNFIGIRGLCADAPPPTSGLYLNDLEGITLAAAARTANQEQVTGAQLLNEKIAFAIRQTGEDLLAALQPVTTRRFNAELQNATFGKFSSAFLPDSLQSRGVQIRRQTPDQLVKLVVKRVAILTETDSSLTVTIADGLNNETFFVETLANIPAEILPNYTLLSDKAYLTTSNAAFNDSSLNGGGGGCATCVGGQNSSYFRVDGWDGTRPTGFTYGLQVEIGASCDETALLCALRDRLGSVILYRAGAELMRERRYTDRANYLNLQTEQAENLEKDWMAVYQRKLKEALSQTPAFLNALQTECITCTGARSAYVRL